MTEISKQYGKIVKIYKLVFLRATKEGMDRGAPFSPFKPKILRTLLLLDVPSSLTTKLILSYPKSESPNSFRSPALPLIMDHIFEKKDNSF